jgi:hypothetical protein
MWENECGQWKSREMDKQPERLAGHETLKQLLERVEKLVLPSSKPKKSPPEKTEWIRNCTPTPSL